MPLRWKQNSSLRLEMTRDEVEVIEKRKASEKARFKESTAVFQPEYTSESEPTAISPKMLRTDRRWSHARSGGFQRSAENQAHRSGSASAKSSKRAAPMIGIMPKRSRLVRCCSRAFRFGCRARTARAGLSAHGTQCLYDAKTGEPYMPLLHLAEKQARICIYNSLLSEAAVLGFDYGYSLDYPNMLCLWEAQFGDFCQRRADDHRSVHRLRGIEMAAAERHRAALPHGYEGQGPEHSSARLERFLQACAEDNIQVCNLTTAAQYFHVLRRQMKRDFVKPLIIMTPKSLLRAKFASSRAEEFTRAVRGNSRLTRSRCRRPK